jgi:hypothetical protein
MLVSDGRFAVAWASGLPGMVSLVGLASFGEASGVAVWAAVTSGFGASGFALASVPAICPVYLAADV